MWYNDSLNLTETDPLDEEYILNRDGLNVVVPLTVVYVIIFITGLVGNIITCVVIAKNKHMHTATNYYLFSLAISDIMLLLSGLPAETLGLWSKHKFILSESFCIVKGFVAETSSNATVLTITAFTVERYLAICHPFRSFSLSKLSRAVLFILFIWIVSGFLAIPMAVQFGILSKQIQHFEASYCSVKTVDMAKAFVLSSFVVFVLPMTVITALYVLIALKLRISSQMSVKRSSVKSIGRTARATRTTAHQQHVIKMLVAVVVGFFICWAPFHAQRLLALHLKHLQQRGELAKQSPLLLIYDGLLHVSGILYFLSTTVNPVLYNIMSLKFRMAFKSTLSRTCCLEGAYMERRSPYGTVRVSSHRLTNNRTSTTTLLTKVRRIQQHTAQNAQAPEVVYETRIALEREDNLNANTAASVLSSDGRTNKALRNLTRKIRSLPSTGICCHKASGDLQLNAVANTNAISNSSLLDLDPSEFTRTELAEIINHMKTDPCRDRQSEMSIAQTAT